MNGKEVLFYVGRNVGRATGVDTYVKDGRCLSMDTHPIAGYSERGNLPSTLVD